MLYFSSDRHFNHKNILKYDHDRGSRFKTLEEMNEYIVERINEVIPEGALLYFLGDLHLGNNDQALELIKRIKCQKVWITGNHDSTWSINKLGGEFLSVQKDAIITWRDRTIYLTHYPPVDYDGKVKYDPKKYDVVVHGHSHKPKYYDNCADVSYDWWKLVYDIDEIIGNCCPGKTVERKMNMSERMQTFINQQNRWNWPKAPDWQPNIP